MVSTGVLRRGEGELSGNPETGAGRVPYWHAVRTHRLLIIGVTVIALIVALLVVQTSTKRYDADADLSINPRGAFATTDPLAGAPPTAVFFQPADGSSVTTEAARLFSSPAYLSAFYASRAFRRLGPRAGQPRSA